MSTLTRRPSGSRLPDYKEYMNFVSGYGKQSADSTDGKTGKTLEPTVILGKSCESYSNFLEKTKSKKFGSVKPPIVASPSSSKKTVKTEIFLEINNTRNDETDISTTRINMENGNTEQKYCNGGVEAKKKMFENSSNDRQYTNKHKSENSFKSNTITNAQKKLLSAALYEKMSNQHNSEIQDPANATNPTNCNPKDSSVPDKIMQNGISTYQIAQDSMKSTEETQTISQSNNSTETKKHISTLSTQLQTIKLVEEEISYTEKQNNSCESVCPPPPPPMPVYVNGGAKISSSPISKERNENIQPKSDKMANTQYNIPPPPPMMNGSKMQYNPDTEKTKTMKNGNTSTLDRNNPLVRKLAYGAMLDMYGAYHDKANSYVATLPKNKVKKANGLQKIIDNIAAQGGLEKLSGRSNPKAENE